MIAGQIRPYYTEFDEIIDLDYHFHELRIFHYTSTIFTNLLNVLYLENTQFHFMQFFPLKFVKIQPIVIVKYINFDILTLHLIKSGIIYIA